MAFAVMTQMFMAAAIASVRMATVMGGPLDYPTSPPTTTTQPVCQGQADIVFILDASGSIGETNYQLQKQFLADVVDQFTVGASAVRFSAVVFSSTTSLQFNLNRYTTKADIKQAILALPYEADLTNTGKALKLTREQAFSAANGARPGVPKIAVVSTDGASTDPSDTSAEATLLKASGVTVLVVGIGSGVNDVELNTIASSPSLVFTVTDFNVLNAIKARLVQSACKGQSEKNKQTPLTSCIANSCVGKPDGNYPACDPECRQGYYYTCSNEYAHKMPCGLGWYVAPNGNRFTARMVFNPSTNTCELQSKTCPRDPYQYVVVVPTDPTWTGQGWDRSCIGPGSTCRGKRNGNYPLCSPECKSGYYISCSNGEAIQMPCALGWYVDNQNNRFTAKMVYNPSTDTCELTSSYCPRATPSNPGSYGYTTKNPDHIGQEECDAQADILLILDSSGSIGQINYNIMADFAASLTSKFMVGPTKVRFAAILFSDDVLSRFNFSTYPTNAGVFQGLLGLSYLGGGTNTADALKDARTFSFQTANGARSNAPDVAVVITDGLSNDPSDTSAEAALLKASGVTVLVVGIGSGVNDLELNTIASSPSLVFTVTDFNVLDAIRSRLVQSACQGQSANNVTCITDSCVGKPSGNYPACDPECRQGYYYTCSNDYAYKMPCGLGWYVAPNGATFTARMVFSPSIKTCVLESESCPRDPYQYVVSTSKHDQTWTGRGWDGSCISPGSTCRDKPDGNYPLCHPECQSGYYISCSNGEAIQMPCALGWYVDNQNNRFTARMVYNPSTDTCELTSSYCPRGTPENTGDPGHSAEELCDAQADILLCLDSSGSIGQMNYGIMANFAASLTSNFQIGPTKVRFAAAVYSGSVSSRFTFSTYQTNAQIYQDLSGIPYLSDLTNTAAVLNYARTTVFPTARPNVGQVAVVITDGFSDSPAATALEADMLRQTGVTVLAVGVGSNVNHMELLAIASSPGLVFSVSSFTGLAAIKNRLTRDVCQAAVGCTNSSKADCLFILDSSGSITDPNWQLMLGFAANISRLFTLGADDVLFSVLSFSDTARRDFGFTRYLTNAALKQGLLALSYIGAGTNTSDALQEARTYSFTPANGARAGVPKVAIVITDGASYNATATATEASNLKNSGVTVIAIGVGMDSNSGAGELQAIASSPNLVFQVSDFNVLAAIRDLLVTTVCQS
ncbi:unnamed protein product [Lymnaea stagnalis]|uniref:VWFA domain-containing protein n=1 Tax=Lymnaea stagnalis TaxID=6523 RepID=A0AAV2IHT6_LYMST